MCTLLLLLLVNISDLYIVGVRVSLLLIVSVLYAFDSLLALGPESKNSYCCGHACACLFVCACGKHCGFLTSID